MENGRLRERKITPQRKKKEEGKKEKTSTVLPSI